MAYRDELTRMTKIEIVVHGDDLAAVRDLLRVAGVAGFTVVSGVGGLGHTGYHRGSLLFNELDAQDLLIAVAHDDIAETVIAGVRELLSERPGVMFVSETWVSRPEYFRTSTT